MTYYTLHARIFFVDFSVCLFWQRLWDLINYKISWSLFELSVLSENLPHSYSPSV